MRKVLLFGLAIALAGCSMTTSPWDTYTNEMVGFELRYPDFVQDPDHLSCKRWIPARVVRDVHKVSFIQDFDLDDDCQKITPTNSERAKLPPENPDWRVADFVIHFGIARNEEEILTFARKIYGPGCRIASKEEITPYEVSYTFEAANPGKTPEETDCTSGLKKGMFRFNPESNGVMTWTSDHPFLFDESGNPSDEEILGSFRFTEPRFRIKKKISSVSSSSDES